MKRLHVHVAVSDLKDSVRFYSQLFASEPTVLKPDYAKWMLEDPRVNFAISDNDDRRVGINHLGVQAESSEELEEINVRLKEARQASFDQKSANCCYAVADKHWATDPSGIVWEMFHTMSDASVYGDDRGESVDPLVLRETDKDEKAASCCRSA